MKPIRPDTMIQSLLLAFWLMIAFCFSTKIDQWFDTWEGNRARSGSSLALLLGEGRKMFAGHFFVKGDAYFHSGYYPTMYDNREAFQTPHLAEDAGAMKGKNQGDEDNYLGESRDWIDRFGRQFFPSSHSHLDQGGASKPAHAPGELSDSDEVREILPWLKISAELDPQRVETYMVTAYWLRQRLGKIEEAERFLRQGLKANPQSYAILFELGRMADENHHDPSRARNLWELALRYWNEQEIPKKEPDKFLLMQISSHLALLEEREGNFPQALVHLETWKKASPHPQEIAQRIAETKSKWEQARILVAPPEKQR